MAVAALGTPQEAPPARAELVEVGHDREQGQAFRWNGQHESPSLAPGGREDASPHEFMEDLAQVALRHSGGVGEILCLQRSCLTLAREVHDGTESVFGGG